MSASARAVVLALALAPVCFAEDKPAKFKRVEKLWSGDAEVGQYGPIARGHRFDGSDGSFREYVIEEITPKKQLLIREEVGVGSARKKFRFFVEGLDTSKLVTGREIDLDGFFRVPRTERRGRETLLVLELLTAAERKRLEDLEK